MGGSLAALLVIGCSRTNQPSNDDKKGSGTMPRTAAEFDHRCLISGPGLGGRTSVALVQVTRVTEH